jgi:RNA polymerase sigma factor (sigma-70 family)
MSASIAPIGSADSPALLVPAGTASHGFDPVPVLQAVAVLCARAWRAEEPLDEREAWALATIYHRYAHMMLGVARRLLGREADAEDVVHEVFCRLPCLLPQYRGRGLGGWLKQVVVTSALMQMRRVRTRREESGVEHPMDGGRARSVGAAAGADDNEVAWALRRLTPPLREVVVLRFFVGFSHREIGRVLDISPAASEVRLCRAVKQLRLLLLPRAVLRAAGDGRSGARRENPRPLASSS